MQQTFVAAPCISQAEESVYFSPESRRKAPYFTPRAGYNIERLKMPDYTSLVPKYTFPGTLAEQEEALASNPLMQRLLAATGHSTTT